jgi:hypothetical protein
MMFINGLESLVRLSLYLSSLVLLQWTERLGGEGEDEATPMSISGSSCDKQLSSLHEEGTRGNAPFLE